ncbi:polysaccharide biosynthesis protein [Thioclava sp. A2]|uniref:polysaccharide biosynthesis protein n=1 Tax=Thioclava sp. FCG-A2 TaxID=3080562 RepID=UPI0029550342|nr:polysaccharide biosynthesis protein [Thioclava sp. A2]MDV7270756.1 polysaccharide biosynthesis protein [Thioclava sp. A2]
MALARELRDINDMMVYAFLDDNLHMEGMVLNGIPVYAGVRAGKLREHFNINTVILALPDASEERRTLIATRLGRMGIEVQNISAFAEFSSGKRLLEAMTPTAPTALLAREALHETLEGGRSVYCGQNILVSGAGGSIGVELCRQIMQCSPAKLVLYEISEIALYHAENEMRVLAEQTGAVIVPVLGSIADETQVRAVLESHKIDVVFHAAAYKHVPIVEANARVGVANNSLGTAVLAKAAARAKVSRFVLVSSDKAVRPGNLMGASKRVAELVVQDLAARFGDTVFSIVRFGNVLGSSGSVIPKFQDQIERGGPVTLTNERVTRYFMTIPEAARLVLEAGAFDESGTLYVLDMGKPMRIADLARKMIEAAGYTVRDANNPEGDIEIVTTGLRPGEKLHEELFIQKNAERTSHPKIMKIREAHLSELETAAVLRSLRDAIDGGDDEAVIAAVVRAVQEYAPQSLPDNAPQMRAVQQRDARVALPPAE